MGTATSKKEKKLRVRSPEAGNIDQSIQGGGPLPSEQGVLINMSILFNFIRQHAADLYAEAIQETAKEFGEQNPPINGMKLASMIIKLPPPQKRKKTWKESAGRKTGGDGYRFGDLTASLTRKQGPNASKQRRHRESVKRLFFQYRSICNEMSQQELVDMALKFFPHYTMKDCIEGMRMFQQIHKLQRKLSEDLNNLLRLIVRLTKQTLYYTLAKTSELYALGLSFDEIERLVEQIAKAEELSYKPSQKALTEDVKLPEIKDKVLSLIAKADGVLVPVPSSKAGDKQSTMEFYSANNSSFLDILSTRIQNRNEWRYLHNKESKFKTVFPIFRSYTGCVMGMLQPGYKRILA